MLGWFMAVHRQLDGGRQPAPVDAPRGGLVAEWQASTPGKRWLDDLAQAGSILFLGGNGYPFHYTGRAIDLLPRLIPKPPDARDRWLIGGGDVATEKWRGETFLDAHAFVDCDRDEWLYVEVWDES